MMDDMGASVGVFEPDKVAALQGDGNTIDFRRKIQRIQLGILSLRVSLRVGEREDVRPTRRLLVFGLKNSKC